MSDPNIPQKRTPPIPPKPANLMRPRNDVQGGSGQGQQPVEWQRSAPSRQATAPQVNEGDCCSSLAAQQRGSDYQSFYKAQSLGFRQAHPNPNQLTPGYPYIVSAPQQKQQNAPSTQISVSIIHLAQVSLRVKLVDNRMQPLKVQHWTLTGVSLKQGARFKDDSLPGGLLDVKSIPLDARSATLRISFLPRAPYTRPDPAKPQIWRGPKMPYPPLPNPREFQDAEDEAYTGKPPDEMEMTLCIGCLPPHASENGVRARLENLGFTVGNALEAAIHAFQAWDNRATGQNKPLTGRWRDVSERLKQLHDDP